MNVDEYIVPGFLANGISAGIKEQGRKDLALIFSEVPARTAGVFTTNCFKAAPVLVDMERISSGMAQAIVTNSGNANAATGAKGYQDALAMSRAAAMGLNISEELVMVASTGVIGHPLPVERIEKGMGPLVGGLRREGIPDAEAAMMTTDRFPKMSCRKARIGSRDVTLCGIAKGAGMIQPNMATMLAYLMTDADIDSAALRTVFSEGIAQSFNAISVDGCMSTNDTALILANGRAGNRQIRRRSREYAPFREMLFAVLDDLCRGMVRDGEGATKLIELVVDGARTEGEARRVAYAVANSNLVKTAFYGGDPNWGRIISAAGSIGIPLPVNAVRLVFEEVCLFEAGQGTAFPADRVAAIMAQETIRVRLELGMGNKGFRIYASDLPFEYVKINAHYHT
ncbi:glutamate N-acetyltransferase [Syntrophus gentianae]|uniref:Arginine biosynthesis bifunctional protein ArgJ n=1 Tax=Syntrophus gentianae TaxID=43775 RepID=A0A1H7ZQK2_9BACT|nr:bifunctional glutamate N-acetyltransferase/amino-acid acetyltransferase ArgJ [Syntrophus gentianae]SEM60695.1 glutamate N-acetyltransferase [Syntrophus gentianae]